MKTRTMFSLYVPREHQDSPLARQAVVQCLLQRFGGYTVANVDGGYTMADGSVAIESVWRFDIVCAGTPEDREYMRVLARSVRYLLRQESVLLTARKLEASFV